MRKVLLGLVAVAVLGLACFAPLSQAEAAPWGFHGGHHGHGHGHGHIHGHIHGYPYHGWGHYDYHGPSLQWHGNHWDYVPAHYDYHYGPHYGW